MPVILFLLIAASLIAQPYNGIAFGSPTHSGGALTGSSVNYYTLPAGANCPSFPCTIEMWINASGTTNWAEVMSGSNWSMQRGPGTAAYVRFGAVVVESGATSITSGAVHLVMASLDGSSVRVFVDGVHRGTTSGTAPIPTGTITLGQNWGGGTIDEVVIWTIDKYPGTTTFTPTTSWPDNTAGIRAIYHLTTNANDTTSGGGPALSATFSLGAGWVVNPTGGTAPYTLQRQSYAGACSTGTFANEGSAVTGVATGAAVYSSVDLTVRCVRYVITDAASASINTSGITTPASGGGGMRSY